MAHETTNIEHRNTLKCKRIHHTQSHKDASTLAHIRLMQIHRYMTRRIPFHFLHVCTGTRVPQCTHARTSFVYLAVSEDKR